MSVPRGIASTSCPRCGEVYWTETGNKFYPALRMYPVTTDGVVSKWMLTGTRPLMIGEYECRFRHTDPHHIRLWWNGMRFVSLKGEPVDMTHFLSWRGMLA
ncbi:MAG TPA: hypothetical protein VF680_17520 [Allosphingosinicella sp.]|jgi:hypothetical protein